MRTGSLYWKRGGEYKKQNNNNYNKTERDRRRGWVGQRRAEMSGADGGAVGVRGGVCWCVSVCCVLSGDVYVYPCGRS